MKKFNNTYSNINIPIFVQILQKHKIITRIRI